MAMPIRHLYLRLAAFYFFHFGVLGALVPYLGVYLRERGFHPTEIGELLAILVLTKIFAPYLWAWLGDRTGHRVAIIRHASLATVVVFAGIYVARAYWEIAAVIAAFSFFWNATLPQLEVTTLEHLGRQAHRYGRIRLWGSVGFILAVVAGGIMLDCAGAQILPHLVITLLAGIWLASLALPPAETSVTAAEKAANATSWWRGDILALFAVIFLMQASLGPYFGFFSLYLEWHGYDRAWIGGLWAVGVVAEIGVLWYIPELLARWGAHRLLLAALAVTAGRWLLTAWFADKIAILAIAQALHLATFGLFHAAVVQTIFHRFPGHLQGRGQALYGSLGYGLGGACGSAAGGYLWQAYGPPSMYLVSAGACLFALALARYGMRVEPRGSQEFKT